ncbi:glycosyltransferase, partial [Enterococcus faecalis]|uniref:glycosyltransferase n=1 Tax=Enterococcus faecalis TaxID=1351 RepID=UPI003D6A513F
DNINFESKQLLYFMIKHTQINAELTSLKINPHFFKNVVTSERITKTAYYRIAIPELFRGTQIERLLYMDCDMIALD